MSSQEWRQALLQLHLSDQQVYCLLSCGLYESFDDLYSIKYSYDLQNDSSIMFAEETNIFTADSDINDVCKQLNDDLSLVQWWLFCNNSLTHCTILYCKK